jgi:hypothetical protein
VGRNLQCAYMDAYLLLLGDFCLLYTVTHPTEKSCRCALRYVTLQDSEHETEIKMPKWKADIRLVVPTGKERCHTGEATNIAGN